MFEVFGVPCGTNMHAYVTREDASRINILEKRAHENYRDSKMRRKQEKFEVLEEIRIWQNLGGVSYGLGIDESV